jgi:hypothetical protein
VLAKSAQAQPVVGAADPDSPSTAQQALSSLALFAGNLADRVSAKQLVVEPAEQAAIAAAVAESKLEPDLVQKRIAREQAAVTDVASSLGFDCVSIDRDGQCFGQSVSVALATAELKPQSKEQVRDAIAADLCARIEHWHPFSAEHWTRPQFRTEVERWRQSGNPKSPIMDLGVAAAANAFHATLVLLCSRQPRVRVVPPSHGGMERVLWLGYEDNETEPHFCALKPRSDSMPFLKHVVVAVQTGASMLVSDSAVVLAPSGTDGVQDGAAASPDLDPDGDADMTPAESKSAKVRTCLLHEAPTISCRSPLPRTRASGWNFAALPSSRNSSPKQSLRLPSWLSSCCPASGTSRPDCSIASQNPLPRPRSSVSTLGENLLSSWSSCSRSSLPR